MRKKSKSFWKSKMTGSIFEFHILKRKEGCMVKKKVRRIEDEVEPGRRMELEEPGKPRDYDMPKEMVAQMNSEFDLDSLLNEIKDRDPKEMERSISHFGRRFMERVIELGDKKYKDRTAEMIERVAQMTKISFPHQFQRYVLCLKPLNQYNVLRSTTKEIEIEVKGCSPHNFSLLCGPMCKSMVEVASQKTGDRISVKMDRDAPANGSCRFTFTLNR